MSAYPKRRSLTWLSKKMVRAGLGLDSASSTAILNSYDDGGESTYGHPTGKPAAKLVIGGCEAAKAL